MTRSFTSYGPPIIVAALALAAGLLFLAGMPVGFPVDDAYIHLVYARNLVEGHGLVFNLGEPSLGTTSPLWVGLIRLGLPWLSPEVSARLWGLLALAASAALLAVLARGVLSARAAAGAAWTAVAAGLLFAVSGNYLWIAFSGMESAVFLACGLLALAGLSRGRPGPVTGVALALLVLVRIEGLALYLIVLGWWVIARPQPKRAALWFFPAPVVLLLQAAWMHARCGAWMPTTMAGKLASNLFNRGLSIKGPALFLGRHLDYLARWNPELLALLILTALAGVITLFSRPRASAVADRPSPPTLALLWLWAGGNLLLHAFLFRSTEALTPYHDLRYQVALFPALILGGLWAMTVGQDRLSRTGRPAVARAVAGLALAALLAVSAARSVTVWRGLYRHDLLALEKSHRAAALWVRDRLPEEARLAAFDIGGLKYFSGRYVLDLGGLVDPAVQPALRERRVGPLLRARGVTHYLGLDRYSEERITGVRAADGKLYHLRELARFDAPDYPRPVILHSLAVVVYQLE